MKLTIELDVSDLSREEVARVLEESVVSSLRDDYVFIGCDHVIRDHNDNRVGKFLLAKDDADAENLARRIARLLDEDKERTDG